VENGVISQQPNKHENNGNSSLENKILQSQPQNIQLSTNNNTQNHSQNNTISNNNQTSSNNITHSTPKARSVSLWTSSKLKPNANVQASILQSSAGLQRTFTEEDRKKLDKQTESIHLQELKERYINKLDPRTIYDTTGKTIGKGSVGEVFFCQKYK